MKTILILFAFQFLWGCNLNKGRLDSEAEIWLAEAYKEQQSQGIPQDDQKKTGKGVLSNADDIRQEIESIDAQIAGLNDRLRGLRRNNKVSDKETNTEIADIEKKKKDLLSRRKNLEARLT